MLNSHTQTHTHTLQNDPTQTVSPSDVSFENMCILKKKIKGAVCSFNQKGNIFNFKYKLCVFPGLDIQFHSVLLCL